MVIYLFAGAEAGVAGVDAGAGLVAFLTCFLVVFLAVLVLGAVLLAGGVAGVEPLVWAAKPAGRLSAAEIIAIATVLIFLLLFPGPAFLSACPT
jgi:fumarate reductase subunit C